MKLYDLTHTINEDMPVWPGSDRPALEHVDEGGCRETVLRFWNHTGTHMDAPAHMEENGATLDTLPLSAFCGTAYIMDCTALDAGDRITAERLRDEELEDVDFLILSTGWDIYWGREEYYGDFPALTPAAAEYLAGLPLKGVGVDAISVDPMPSRDFPVHHQLLGAGMVIIENLCALTELRGERVGFAALPVKFDGADGSPVRAIAAVK